ncbi:hypothetical protein HID58_019129 [Brassica napus]|uniref:Uncharacterized protein n=2 Tax=Brassica napus TaxID=3708 RepID=A0ABQ8DDP8_BRANA|nr:hypothetical protein HID58_019129 [Brassica napus]
MLRRMAEEQLYQQMYQLGDVLNEATDSYFSSLGSDGVDGLASATLNIIVEEAYRIRDLRTAEKNLQTTASNIGKKDQMHSLNKNKKRIQELTTALALRPDTAANAGQIAHWTREKEACETRVANMEQNN